MSPQIPPDCGGFSDFSCFWWPWWFWGGPVNYFVEWSSISVCQMCFPWLAGVQVSWEEDHRCRVTGPSPILTGPSPIQACRQPGSALPTFSLWRGWKCLSGVCTARSSPTPPHAAPWKAKATRRRGSHVPSFWGAVSTQLSAILCPGALSVLPH